MTQVEAPWSKMPLELTTDPATTLADVRLYSTLDYLAGKRGWWYGSQERIAEETGMAERSIRRAMNSLIERGYIETQRLGVEYGTVLRYVIVARNVSPPAISDRPTTATHSASHPAKDGRSLGQQWPLARPRMAAAYKEPQTSPQTSTTDLNPPNPQRGKSPAQRGRDGSRRQRDVAAMVAEDGPQARYFTGKYGRILAERVQP